MSKLAAHLAASLVLVVAAGCACHGPSGAPHPRLTRGDVSVVFNPPCTDFLSPEVARVPWPVTPAALPGTEHVSYTQTLIDLQGRAHRQDDYFRREFIQVRTGTSDATR